MLLLFLAWSAAVQAQFDYWVNDGQVTITRYTGPGGAVAIPETIESLPVTRIGDTAFFDCTSLTAAYFQGNAPGDGGEVFFGNDRGIVYYLPGTTGWGPTFSGRPTAVWRPRIEASVVQDNKFGFTISWAGERTVVVEACSDLAHPVWSVVETQPLTDGAAEFSDPAGASEPARFYRVRSP